MVKKIFAYAIYNREKVHLIFWQPPCFLVTLIPRFNAVNFWTISSFNHNFQKETWINFVIECFLVDILHEWQINFMQSWSWNLTLLKSVVCNYQLENRPEIKQHNIPPKLTSINAEDTITQKQHHQYSQREEKWLCSKQFDRRVQSCQL